MLKFLPVLISVFLVGCECTDDSCTSQQAPAVDTSGSGVVQSDVMVSDTLVAQLGDKTKVYFDFDKYVVKSEYSAVLQDQASWLQAHPGVMAVIEGHCDERGTREYNLALGEKRANAVKDHLISLGVDGNRLQVISYGKDRPLVLGSTKEAWAQNRVAITIQK